MKWALELSEYDIHYMPRTAIKGHAMAGFATELKPPADLEASRVYSEGSRHEYAL